MKNLIILSIFSFLFILSGCSEKISLTHANLIRNEVDEQFNKMLQLAEDGDAAEFKKSISKEATLVVEGIYLSPEDVPDYYFEIFKSFIHEDTKINTNFYKVLTNSIVYQEVVCYPRPIDTTRGITLKPAPIDLYYLSKADADKKDQLLEQTGTAVYIIEGADSSKQASLGYRLPPIKMLGYSVIFKKVSGRWFCNMGHLSLGLKPSVTYGLDEKMFNE